MARHNREGRGTDQLGFEYQISYQPDWLRMVKVTRNLRSGRQSTMTLFRNPVPRGQRSPGDKVRTRIFSRDQDVDFEVVVHDPRESVELIRVRYRLDEDRVPDSAAGQRSGRWGRVGAECIEFLLEGGLEVDPETP